ncbi:MAG: CPBP family intramembrane metalloprotease [Christensenellaceae bacterium]|nr:CPBP family intramembrane metalloprotease [Christensenellaceae bacterium]
MTERTVKKSIYALSMLLVVFMRIAVSEGILRGLDDISSDAVWSTTVQCLIFGLIPFSLYFVYLKTHKEKRAVNKIFGEFGYRGKISLKGAAIVLIISLLTPYLISCLSSVWYTLISDLGYKSVSGHMKYTTGILFADIALTAVLPALFEEFTNRGLLYSASRNPDKPLRVIFLTAAMFALMHTNVTQVFYTFFFGLITGGLVYVTKSIWPAVFCHFVNNFVSVMRSYLSDVGKSAFFDKIYNLFTGSVWGVTGATLLFFVAVFIVFVLFLRLSAVESDRRMKCGEEVKTYDEVTTRYENLPLVFAAVLNGIITVITLVWGIIR